MSDPEAFERRHDEELLRTTDPSSEDPEEVQSTEGTDTDATEEEDLEEGQRAEDIELIEVSSDEDPEEDDFMAEVRVLEEDTDLTTEQVMETVVEQTVDEGTEGDIDEAVDDGVGSSGLQLPPPTTEREPTPPPLPVSPLSEEFEELTPEPQQTEAAQPAEPSTPPHVPIAGIPVCVHNWIVGGLHRDLADAEARLAESRAELAAERAARLERQGGGGRVRSRGFYREVTRIELRARVRVRALPTFGEDRVSRAAAEEIFTIAMARIRALGRRGG